MLNLLLLRRALKFAPYVALLVMFALYNLERKKNAMLEHEISLKPKVLVEEQIRYVQGPTKTVIKTIKVPHKVIEEKVITQEYLMVDKDGYANSEPIRTIPQVNQNRYLLGVGTGLRYDPVMPLVGYSFANRFDLLYGHQFRGDHSQRHLLLGVVRF